MHDTETLIALTSQCVRCGLCLPHCPTYQLSQEEPESPRGRIALLAASANATLDWQPSIQQHIDQCLACGHCERVCPAQVPYRQLLIQGRAHLAQQRSLPWQKKIIIKIIETPTLRNFCYALISALQILRLWRASIALTQKFYSKKLANAMRIMPMRRKKKFFVPNQKIKCLSTKKILLFPGCSGKILSPNTLAAAKQLLQACDYEPIEPRSALCCGALSTHAGLGEHTAQHTAQTVQQLCVEQNITQIVMIATGCSSFANTLTQFQPNLRILDIQQFLIAQWPISIPLNTKPLRIAVHTPCTQTNGLHDAQLSYRLLKHLPHATLIPFGAHSCCGAAGLNMFEHPEKAMQLAAQLLTEKLLSKCDIIVTSNIGCQLHFQNFLTAKKIVLQVCHPIEVLLE